eukprot:gene7294-5136_t
MTHTSSEALADLLQDTRLLQERLAEAQRENHLLRRQLHTAMALLDVAVSKLASCGLSLDTPADIRALRADALRGAVAETAGTPGKERRDSDPTATTASTSRKFNLFKTLQHHTKAVHCCAFAPGEAEALVSGGLDNQLVLQNFARTDTKLWSASHKECVSDVAWMSTNFVVSASYDGTARVWDSCRGGAVVHQYQAEGLVLAVAPLEKNVFAAADSRQNVAIVDTRAHKPSVREINSRVNSLAFDSASCHLFMGQSDGCVTVWDIRRTGAALSPPEEAGHSMKRVWTAPNTEAAHSGIAYIAHVHSGDDARRLVTVTNDHVVRLYHGTLSAPSSGGGGARPDLYALHTSLPRSLEMRGYSMRAAFWRGVAPRRPESPLYDDGEKDAEAALPRRITESDLLITGGPSNKAVVLDVSVPGSATVVEALDGHRDRVTGAAVRHTTDNLILATSSADATVRIWLPAKS